MSHDIVILEHEQCSSSYYFEQEGNGEQQGSQTALPSSTALGRNTTGHLFAVRSKVLRYIHPKTIYRMYIKGLPNNMLIIESIVGIFNELLINLLVSGIDLLH